MQNQKKDKDCSYCYIIIQAAIEELNILHSDLFKEGSPQHWRVNKIYSNLLSILPDTSYTKPKDNEIDNRISELDAKIFRLVSEVSSLRTLKQTINKNKIQEFVDVKYNGLLPLDSPHLTEEEKKNALIAAILEREKKLESSKRGGKKDE